MHYICFRLYFFLLPLYSVGEVWECIWIQSSWLYWIYVSRDYTTLQYLTLRHAQTVGFNDLSCLQHTEQSIYVTERTARRKESLRIDLGPRVKVQLSDANFLYDQSTLSRITNAYIYLPKAILELETIRSAARCLNHSDTQWSYCNSSYDK